MSDQVEVSSQEPRSVTTVVGGDGAPWWVRYLMQAGFLGVLILVLIGAYQFMTTQAPQIATSIDNLGKTATETLELKKRETAAQEGQAKALDAIADALEASSEAQETQAAAIERWVNLQGWGPRQARAGGVSVPEAPPEP